MKINTLIKITLSLFILILLSFIIKMFYIKQLVSYLFYLFIPLMIALFIQLILDEIIHYFDRGRIKRKYIVIFIYFFIISISLIMIYKILPPMIDYLVSLYDQYTNKQLRIHPLFHQSIHLLNEYQLIDPLINTMKDLSSSALSYISSLILGIGISFYLTIDNIHIIEKLITYIPFDQQKEYMKTLKRIKLTTFTFIKSIFIDFIILFLLSFVSFFFINKEYCFYIALFLAITNLIPYIGPFIGSMIIFFYQYMIHSSLGYISLIILIILQYIESSYIQPLLFSKKMHTHPIVLLLSLTLFKDLFGIIGMILSPLIVSYIRFISMLIKDLFYDKIKEKKGLKE